MKEVTAKVPFSIILLQDFVTSKKCPAEFKCRQLLPTSGQKSSSLWDVTDSDALLAWLTENITTDCTHEVYEVQEDFSIGLGDVIRQRAYEKTAKTVGAAASAAGHQVSEFDHKLKISERAGHAVETVRDSQIAQSTAAAFQRAGSTLKTTTNKVLETPQVASAAEAVGSGFRKLGQSLSSLTGRQPKQTDAEAAAALYGLPTQTSSTQPEYEPPVQPTVEDRAASNTTKTTSPPAAQAPAFTIADDEKAP